MTRAADPAAGEQLQHLTRQLVLSLMDYYTHEELPGARARFGLPAPPPEAVPPATLTRRQRLAQVFAQIDTGTSARSSLGSSTTVSSHRTPGIRPKISCGRVFSWPVAMQPGGIR